ncbi:MAG: recombinase family protein [Rhodomicrobium sp.]|jgi:excisionase family DNA binding protein
MSKIQKDHLDRAAYVYVRQSSPAQVEQNLESQRRQYGLVERAKTLGWRDIRVIDEDLGRSGSGCVERRGFERLLSEVCQGQAGAVFAIEASRLARNGHDWHRLLEFCQIVDTLIVDHDGVYDPKHPNDRLILGLKGTMSEVELSMFRQRSREAIRQQAQRGEYFTRVAEGYVLGEGGRLEKDPDEQVQRLIGLIFEKFRELGSARQVQLWFRQEEIELPKRVGKSALGFVPAAPWTITRILKDPVYAGAYAFGRISQQVVLDNGRKRVLKRRHARPEDWDVLLQGHHEGFISWAEYLKNQETLMHNRNQLGETVRGAARAGKGLLAGLLRCGNCGKKMRVRYCGRSSRKAAVVYYQCIASQGQPEGKQLCSLCGGFQVEQAVENAVLESLAPVRMEAFAQAADQLAGTRAQKRRQLELELERARFEAGRCRRQYDAAEPENRLVARTLERRWNEALEKVAALEQALSLLDPLPDALSKKEEDDLRELALDLPAMWRHGAAPFDLKKRIVRAVIKEIVVYVEAATLRVLVHWQGGHHTEINLRKRKAGEHRWKTAESTVALIEQLARVLSDRQIAAQLNRMGIKTAKGYGWTRGRVGNFRTDNAIANYVPGERQARGELTIEEAANRLGVSYSTVQRLIKGRQLPARQICAGAPWIILSEDADHFRDCGGRQRFKAPSSEASAQQVLDFA